MNLESIFRNFSNIAMIVKDNYNFQYVNRLTLNLLGYKETEISKMDIIELLTPDSLECCIKNLAEVRKKGFCQPFNIDILKKNGNILSTQLSGIKINKGQTLLLGRDLSSERKKEKELEYLENFNKNILDSIEEGIIVLNPMGKIIQYNEFMNKRYQWDKRKVKGKNAFELFPDTKEQGLMEVFVSILDEKRMQSRKNVTRTRPDGTRFIMNLKGYPLRKGKKVNGVVLILEDVTLKEKISKQYEKATIMREKVRRITESIIPCNTVSQTIEKIANGISKELGIERGAITLVSEDSKVPILTQIFSSINSETEIKKAEKKLNDAFIHNKGLTAEVYKTRKEKLIKDITQYKNALRLFADTKSEVIVPIKIQKEAIGVLALDNRSTNGFDEIDLKFALLLANSIATSLKKAKIYEELLNKNRYLSLLFEIAQVLHMQQRKSAKIDRILKYISSVLPDYAVLILSIDSSLVTKIIASQNLTKEVKELFNTLPVKYYKKIVEATQNGNPFMVNNLKKKKALLFRTLYQMKFNSLYIFPIMFIQKIIGLFVVIGTKETHLKNEQIASLSLIANQFNSILYKIQDTKNGKKSR